MRAARCNSPGSSEVGVEGVRVPPREAVAPGVRTPLERVAKQVQDATSYKAANRNSKSGMFAYLNDLIIEGNGHRKKCWQHAPPRRTSALELCDRPSSLADK